MATSTRTAFYIDWEYDRDNANPGTGSRYRNYLAQSTSSFAEIWSDDPSVEFAAIAWRHATGPIMAPPLVHRHPRITNVTLARSGWNGELTADVGLVSPRPAALAYAKTADGNRYRDQHRDAFDRYDGIGEEDLTRSAYLLTEARLIWQIPAGTVPTITAVPTGIDAIFDHAVDCLTTLVDALNREVTPIIEQLES